jgi:hypothetical protein
MLTQVCESGVLAWAYLSGMLSTRRRRGDEATNADTERNTAMNAEGAATPTTPATPTSMSEHEHEQGVREYLAMQVRMACARTSVDAAVSDRTARPMRNAAVHANREGAVRANRPEAGEVRVMPVVVVAEILDADARERAAAHGLDELLAHSWAAVSRMQATPLRTSGKGPLAALQQLTHAMLRAGQLPADGPRWVCVRLEDAAGNQGELEVDVNEPTWVISVRACMVEMEG